MKKMKNIKFNFTGKRVLVVGGSRGIGKGVVMGFLSANAKVAYVSKSPMQESNENLKYISCDIRREKEIEAKYSKNKDMSEQMTELQGLLEQSSGNFKEACDEVKKEWDRRKLKKAIVIGSGVSGCMYAMMLKQKNWEVTVIEKAKLTGGGVRTFWHGGHPFTYGPRHFIGPEENMAAFEFLNKIVPMRHIKKINFSYQAKDDFFANYPMHIDDIKKLCLVNLLLKN